MTPDDLSPSLTPDDVATRVSEILAAAERDARAVIEAAHRAPAPPPRASTIEELSAAVEDLAARVAAIERASGLEAPAEAAQPAPDDERRVPAARPPRPEAAARVVAIDLALAGYSRDVIADELGSSLTRDEVDRLLDEVLAS